MRKIVVSEYMTLDGVFEAPGCEDGFEYGGWAFDYQRGPKGDAFKNAELAAADALLLGARTYDIFARTWPQRDGEFADRMNSITKYVLSETDAPLAWANSELLKGDVESKIRDLKHSEGGDILVVGSGKVVNFLFEHELVDELRLMIFPLVLGKGAKLFQNLPRKINLEMIETAPAGDGIQMMTYRVLPVR